MGGVKGSDGIDVQQAIEVVRVGDCFKGPQNSVAARPFRLPDELIERDKKQPKSKIGLGLYQTTGAKAFND